MRYSQLRAFHAVAAYGGFSRAAEQLSLSQPAISDHVRKLEEAHGVELFLRRHGAVALTELGRHLFAITERLFEAESQAEQLLARSRNLDEGTLTIGADAAVHFLPILARFLERYPKVSVKLVSGNSAQLVQRLDAFEVDFAVTAVNPVAAQYASWLLREDRLAAFVAASHPLARRKTLSLADLAKWPVILREQGSVTRTLLLDELGRRGLPLATAIEIETREATKDAVAQGLGIGIISRGEFVSDGRVRLLEFADWTATMSEWLICLRARADLHLMRAMIGMIIQKKRPGVAGPQVSGMVVKKTAS
jgi:LysR family transcriptional regulator, low CO2-responsive transcriptional regulator